MHKYNVLDGLKPGGSFLLNCQWTEEELEENLPAGMKQYLAANHIAMYIIDAVKIAQELGLGGRINMIMQAAFFKISGIIPENDAVGYLKKAIKKSYGKKGEKVVAMNNAAVEQGGRAIIKIRVPSAWKNAREAVAAVKEEPAFIKNVLVPMNRQEGDKLPVSAFLGLEDGSYPMGTAAYEKRGIAIQVPEWQPQACIQCNQCAYVCPHAAIRPILFNEEEKRQAPSDLSVQPCLGQKGLYFSMTVSPADCTGCGNCVQICPAKEKALVMKPLATQSRQEKVWEYAMTAVPKTNPFNNFTVKGSQFEQPLLEFSGACAGCGQTPYAKLVTQLFGDRMMIANATGCSSVWADSVPSIPYTTNYRGHGPAWGNSLFEDNAEYGLGMMIAGKQLRRQIADMIEKAESLGISDEFSAACKSWLADKDKGEGSRDRADHLIDLLDPIKDTSPLLTAIYKNKDLLVKRSQWIFGGDGWAYDIGFGGLDHVLASGADVNVLVFDTEVYSNTGGQSSKATPAAAIAKFAASGKKTKKKDLGMIAMSYSYVYVAQISMGADKNQTLRAIAEAEAYPGPSLIIAYAPCINHGLKAGMGCSQMEAKRAVDSGYWAMYRYNPQMEAIGKNPFVLNSKEPVMNFREFLLGEVRYSALLQQFPDMAEKLFAKTEKDAKEKLSKYTALAAQKSL